MTGWDRHRQLVAILPEFDLRLAVEMGGGEEDDDDGGKQDAEVEEDVDG